MSPTRSSRGSRAPLAKSIPIGRSSRHFRLVAPQSAFSRLLVAAVFAAASILRADNAYAFSTVWGSIQTFFDVRRGPPSKYRLYDSRTVAHTFGPGASQFFWINDEELLFVPMQITPDARSPTKERATFSIARWNIRSGEITRLKEFGTGFPRLCLFEGYVSIRVERDGRQSEAYHGPLGSERQDDPKRAFHRELCRPADMLPKLPAWTEGRRILRLQSLDAGFVDFGELQKPFDSVALHFYKYGARQDQGIPLPWQSRKILNTLQYFDFRKAYFVRGYLFSSDPRDAPLPVYWLYTDGRVEKIADVPSGPWGLASSAVTPFKDGILVASSKFRAATDLSDAGLFLLKNNQIEKLVTGWIEGLAVMVSPDGCKAAFTYAPQITAKQGVLRAMDLCEGGKNDRSR